MYRTDSWRVTLHKCRIYCAGSFTVHWNTACCYFDNTAILNTKTNIPFHKIWLIINSKISDHNGHKPERPKPKRPQTETDTTRNGHKLKRPLTGTATNRNGHKPERTQRGMDITIWFSEPQNCVFDRGFKLESVAISSKVKLNNIGTRLWYSYMYSHEWIHICIG